MKIRRNMRRKQNKPAICKFILFFALEMFRRIVINIWLGSVKNEIYSNQGKTMKNDGVKVDAPRIERFFDVAFYSYWCRVCGQRLTANKNDLSWSASPIWKFRAKFEVGLESIIVLLNNKSLILISSIYNNNNM